MTPIMLSRPSALQCSTMPSMQRLAPCTSTGDLLGGATAVNLVSGAECVCCSDQNMQVWRSCQQLVQQWLAAHTQ